MGSFAIDRRPETTPGKDAIQEQLERLLAHPAFKNSKRCLTLLRYIVEHNLSGEGEALKERTLGVAVFGRPAEYDTNADPIVRATAGEVRKRIAQYYHEPERDGELRIDLRPGSYAPQFHMPARSADFDVATVVTPAHAPPAATRRPIRLLAFAALFAGVVIAGAGVALWPRSAINDFWGPVLESPRPVLLCIGQVVMTPSPSAPKDPASFSISEHIQSMDHIVLPDAIALTRIAGFLGKMGREYSLQGALSTNLTDLRRGPTVLIAAFDNPWTMRLLEPLRFHLVWHDGRPCIDDRQHPQQRDWFVDFGEQYSKLTQDFAIVARFRDATTDETTMVAAGVGENGTIAAGEFVTSPVFLERLSRQLPAGWRKKNVEAVLATQVIDRTSCPPRIVAHHVW